jgi:multidrug efflux pump subunit AcrA (membrane-fusion protein)
VAVSGVVQKIVVLDGAHVDAGQEEARDADARVEALTLGVSVTRADLLAARRDARVTTAQLEETLKRLALLQAGSQFVVWSSQLDWEMPDRLRRAASPRRASARGAARIGLPHRTIRT